MRVLIALVVCCVASVRAAMIKKNESEIQLNDACLIDYGIEPEAISDGSQELTYEQVYCVAACIYKSKGIMNSDGTINEEVVNSYFTADNELEEKEVFYAVYNACKGRTNCELVECMFEKLKSQWGSEDDPEDVSKRLFSSNSIFKF